MARFAPFARLPRPLRWAARVLTVILVLAIIAAGFVTFTIRRSFPRLDGEVALAGLSAPVTVHRDRYGVPHIYADTPDDLLRAQGYVHAQDRFWEMDFRRKTTAGRLSELFGASTLDVDKVVRTLGWRRTAERELPLLMPETRRALDAYAAGVNAWLAQHEGAWDKSLEHAVLKLTNGAYTPEPWTPVDSLAWLKAMAWDLRSNMGAELERAIAASRLPADRVAQLFPGYPYDRNPAIVTGDAAPGDNASGAGASGDGTATTSGHTARPFAAEGRARAAGAGNDGAPPGSPGSGAAVAALEGAARAVRAVPGLLGGAGTDRAGIGSNSWVVSGRFTVTGRPLLANDPHLGPTLPSIWYQAGLHCRRGGPACPYDVVGYTFSGLPGVVIGHNDRIAWGFTNLGPDVSDLYVERVKGDTYRAGGEWRPMEVRRERIAVAGGAPVDLVVRSTGHGPIISEVLGTARLALPGATAGAAEQAGKSERAEQSAQGEKSGQAKGGDDGDGGDGYAIALRWTALEPGRTADGIALLNTARNWTDFRRAAAHFEAPSQNMVYADVDGNIGYQAPGRIPVRATGDGRSPVPGWTGDAEWTGYIPFEKLPSAYNPPEGYIVTANNAVTAEGAGPFLTADWSYGYRARRIVDRVGQAIGQGPVTVDAMAEIQRDAAHNFAPVLMPYLLKVPLPDGEFGAALREVLTGWDLDQGRDSPGAAYFNAVWRHLLKRVFDDELPEGARAGGGDRWFEVVRALLERPGDRYWDDVRTTGAVETREDMLAAASRDARNELRERLGDDPAGWRWGDLHTLTLTNQSFGTSGIGPIEWLFNRGPIRLGGGKDAVDATGWYSAEGYEVDWVPSMRMVVDLADLDRSRWVNLTGASGHPFHANYTDQSDLWADGATIPMRQTERAVRADATATLTLTP